MFKKINMRKVYATALSLLLALPLVSITATPAQAAVATCGTAGTPAVTWLNDPKYYIGISDAYDAGYIGYTVTPTAAVKDMWVGLSNFTGGLVSLAPNQPQYLPSGPTAANTAKTTYFLSKTTATANSTVDQSHTVTVYEGNPNSIGAVALCTINKTFTDIEDTITANANKVNSISTSASTAVMGNTVTTTVFGDTGTIGAGPTGYNSTGVINLSPAVKSNFPANSWRLTKVVYKDTTNNRIFTDKLQLLNEANTGAHAYEAHYSFTAVGTTSTAATIVPIQYISSGTQIKHTGALPTTLPTLPVATNTLTINKSASVTTLPASGGDVEYTVSVLNSGVLTSIDEIIDTLPVGATFKSGSATKDGVSIPDPGSATGAGKTAVAFVGPYEVPANSGIVFKYTMTIPGTFGNYLNSVVGYVGSSQIDASLDTNSNNPASVTVTVPPAVPTVNPINATVTFGSSKTVTPVVTGTDIVASSACLVDPADSVCKKTVSIDGQGTWTVGPTGNITFTPSRGTVGSVTQLTYKISDNYSQTATTTVDFTITEPVGPTLTAPGTNNVPYGAVATKTLAATPGDGAITNYCYVTASGCVQSLTTDEGTWTINNSGVVNFAPVDGFTGITTSLLIKVTDEFGKSDSHPIAFNIALPAAPSANPISGNALFNTPLTINLSITGTNFDHSKTALLDPSDSVYKTVVTVPGEGIWTVNPTSGAVTFTPEANFTGQATTLTYRVTDQWERSASNTASASVGLPTGPSISSIKENTPFETPITLFPDVTTSGEVTERCLVSPVDSSCVQSITVEGKGTYTINGDKIVFTPVAGFFGEVAAVSYKITNSFNQTATTTVQVVVVNPTPPVATPLKATVLFDQDAVWNYQAGVDVTKTCIIDPADSVCKTFVTVANEGVWTVDANGNITFNPNRGFVGAATQLNYRVEDIYGQKIISTINVTVSEPAVPVVSDSENIPVKYNTPKTVTTPHTVIDGNITEFCIVVAETCVVTTEIAEGSLTIDSNGNVTFTPKDGFTGLTPVVTVKATDEYGKSDTGNLSFNVEIPAMPTVEPVSEIIPFGSSKTVKPSMTGTDLVVSSACVIDPADSVCKTLVTVENVGTWSVNTETGEVTFTSVLNYTGTAQITYKIFDRWGQHGNNTVSIQIGVPAGPSINPLTVNGPINTPITLSPTVTSNAEVTSRCLVDSETSTCANSVTFEGIGTYTIDGVDILFTPVDGYVGSAPGVMYEVTDVLGQKGSAIIKAIIDTPAAPTATPSTATTPYNTSVNVALNLSGPVDWSTLCIVKDATCVSTYESTNGTYSVNSNTHVIEFTPKAGYSGTDEVVNYSVKDTYGQEILSNVTVTVEAEVIVTPPPVEPTPTPTPTEPTPTPTPTEPTPTPTPTEPTPTPTPTEPTPTPTEPTPTPTEPTPTPTPTEPPVVTPPVVEPTPTPTPVEPLPTGPLVKDAEIQLTVEVGQEVAGAPVQATATGLKPNAKYVITFDKSGHVHADGLFRGAAAQVYVDHILDRGLVPATGELLSDIVIPGNLTLGWHNVVLDSTFYDGTVAQSIIWILITEDGTLGNTTAKPLTSTVYFTGDSGVLTTRAKSALKALAAKLPKDAANVSIDITSNISSHGRKFDQKLAALRAENVSKYLKLIGLKGKVTIKPVGKALNHTVKARRAVVKITYEVTVSSK